MGIAAKPVRFRHDKGFAIPDLTQQRSELWGLACAGLSADRVGEPEIDLVDSGFDLDPLIVRSLMLEDGRFRTTLSTEQFTIEPELSLGGAKISELYGGHLWLMHTLKPND